MNQRMIAPAFTVSILCAIGLWITYALGGQPQIEGLLLFGAFGGFGTGLILWAKHLFPQGEVEQERHQIESTPEEQKELDDLLGSGIEDVTRRRFLSKFAAGALGAIGIAALFPIKSLGPNPGNSLFITQWRAGMHVTREDGTFVKPTDLEEGGIYTVWPEGVPHEEQSATLLIRYDPAKFVPKSGRENWVVQGNVAYSKICTHVGCPVGLYRKATGQLLCPCHQSTFDVNKWAIPVFGPAARPLPQLPLELLPDGNLGAQSDYHEPVGPGFWNRGRKKVVV